MTETDDAGAIPGRAAGLAMRRIAGHPSIEHYEPDADARAEPDDIDGEGHSSRKWERWPIESSHVGQEDREGRARNADDTGILGLGEL